MTGFWLNKISKIDKPCKTSDKPQKPNDKLKKNEQFTGANRFGGKPRLVNRKNRVVYCFGLLDFV
jgi:hypothetical protein